MAPPRSTQISDSLLPGNSPVPPPGSPGGPRPAKRHLGSKLWVLFLIGPAIAIASGVFWYLKVNETTDQVNKAVQDAQKTIDSAFANVTIPTIVVPEITLPPGITIPIITLPPGVTLPPGITLPQITLPTVPPTVAPTAPPTVPPTTAAPAATGLFVEGGAPQVIAAYEATISGDPSRFLEIILYPDYSFAQAQDANAPTHVDEYQWRAGAIGPSVPVQLTGGGDLESNLFSATEVDWTFIARAVAEAPGLAAVEEGQVSHVIVSRSSFTPDFAVVVRVYVTGPRDGKYLEYTPAGVFIDVV